MKIPLPKISDLALTQDVQVRTVRTSTPITHPSHPPSTPDSHSSTAEGTESVEGRLTREDLLASLGLFPMQEAEELPFSLDEAIRQKTKELEATGLAQWSYADPDAIPPDDDSEAAIRTILWGAPTADSPVFAYLAGPAGSGKTFLARQWAELTSAELVATTGIAAINLGGTTINSLLGYFDTASMQESYVTGRLGARLGKLWRAGVKQIIVDEVSMMDADQLTILKRAIEEVNSRDYVLGKALDEGEEPPSMKLLLVGDFAQLPPVKAEFAFESAEWPAFAAHTVTLSRIRRQADAGFIEALRAARLGDGRKVLEYFGADHLHRQTNDAFEGSTILARNEAVDRYNGLRMAKLQGKEVWFPSSREGEQRSEWGDPKKPSSTWGVPDRLYLKIGALVMILANRRPVLGGGFIYVNGDLGILEDVDEGSTTAYVRLQRTGEVVGVEYIRRIKQVPLDSARRKELRQSHQESRITEDGKYEITGWVQYMPLRVAYATTVHKSQGLSLDAVQIQLGDAFFKTPGMVYVALSRCRTAEGLRLVGTERALIERCTAHPKLVGKFL